MDKESMKVPISRTGRARADVWEEVALVFWQAT